MINQEDGITFKFNTDGTLRMSSDYLSSKAQYKLDDTFLHMQSLTSQTTDENDKIVELTWDDIVKKTKTTVEECKINKEQQGNHWKDYMAYCKNDEEKATKMMIVNELKNYCNLFAISSMKYTFDSTNSKVTIISIFPQITSIYNIPNIRSYFDFSEIEKKYHLCFNDRLYSSDSDLWKDNKVPYTLNDIPAGTSPKLKFATWAVAGESFNQVISIKISATEKYECKMKSEYNTPITQVWDIVN